MADICARHPDRFTAFVAVLPLDNPDAAWIDLDRAVAELGARGVQIFSNVASRPLDRPEYFLLFERMVAFDLPVLIYPERGPSHADYASEARSKYEIWFTCGWP